MVVLGVFTDEVSRVKARFESKFCPVENRPNILVYWRKFVKNVKFCFRASQKEHSCAKRRLSAY